ncbi:MAG: sirohydrochlorin cobaltochelatase, partial [Eggerthellaceae bacterium]|nr:sirohydrochlorin cobaltochelatase [Eggerthellaceae bacterium]
EKALVEEYDYFGRDTGDASLDDPRNQDGIGENEILVVSFGTSFNDSRAADIKAIEDAIAAEYPGWSVRRAFTAQIIINHVYARDGEKIDNMGQALERAKANGVKNLVVQPTHLMHGAEYDEMVAALADYQDDMSISIAEPLLGEVGATPTTVNADKEAVARAVVAAANVPEGTALVLMGHGTSHDAAVTYQQMQAQMSGLGYGNVFVGTVEGEPEGTDAESVIAKVRQAGFEKVVLRPLMVVAGDHANNDMADSDDPESWYSMFTAEGAFAPENVTCQIAGLGRIAAVQQLYVAHVAAAMGDTPEPPTPITLEDGVYKLPDLAAGPSKMFNKMEADSKYLKVEGDAATIYFVQDGSTASVGKYSRVALGKSSEILPDEGNYFADSVLPEGTAIFDGVKVGVGKLGDKWSFAISITKAEAEALFAPDAKLYITVWNNVGKDGENIPGWYKAGDDIYLTLGELGEKVVAVPVYPFAYDGDTLNAIKADGAGFGMFTPQEGTTATRSDGKVSITYYPQNKTTYAGLYFTASSADKTTWAEDNYVA